MPATVENATIADETKIRKLKFEWTMKENKELNAHVKAIGEWAAESKKRVAFVVCGEITEDGIGTTNALVGRNDRIARALFGNAKENDGFKHVLSSHPRQ